jgi:hypothetical protein
LRLDREADRRVQLGRLPVEGRTEPRRALDRELGARAVFPGAGAPAVCDVQMQQTLVEPLALTDVEQVQLVGVVRHEDDGGGDDAPVDQDPLPPSPLACEQQERPEAGQRLLSAPVLLAPVHELGVEAERDVVQEHVPVHAAGVDPALDPEERLERGERIVAIEPEIAREVVARPVGDADERKVALERDLGDGRQRAVATGDAEALRIGCARELRCVLALGKEMRLDAARACAVAKRIRTRVRFARARIDEEKSAQWQLATPR